MSVAHLTHLETAGLIVPLVEDRELTFRFRHALLQQAAYQSLLKADRRALHQAVGETLEKQPAATKLASTLALHFEYSADGARAVQWLRCAGDEAAARFALQEATDFYQRALARLADLPPDPGLEFHLRLQWAVGQTTLGQPPSRLLQELQTCLQLAPTPEMEAQAHFAIGRLLHVYASLDLPTAERHYRAALALVTPETHPALYGTLLAHLSVLDIYQGRDQTPLTLLAQAQALAEQHGERRLLAEVYVYQSWALASLGRTAEAQPVAARGQQLALEIRDAELLGKVRVGLCNIYLARADSGQDTDLTELHTQSHAMLEEGRTWQVPILQAMGHAYLGIVALFRQDYATARTCFIQAAPQFRSFESWQQAMLVAAHDGVACLALGQPTAAAAAFAQAATDSAAQVGCEFPQAEANLAIAVGCARAHLFDQALVYFEQAVAALPPTNRRQWLQRFQADSQWGRLFALPDVQARLRALDDREQ